MHITYYLLNQFYSLSYFCYFLIYCALKLTFFLWANSASADEFFCNIELTPEVGPEGDAPFMLLYRLSSPYTCYRSPSGLPDPPSLLLALLNRLFFFFF